MGWGHSVTVCLIVHHFSVYCSGTLVSGCCNWYCPVAMVHLPVVVAINFVHQIWYTCQYLLQLKFAESVWHICLFSTEFSVQYQWLQQVFQELHWFQLNWFIVRVAGSNVDSASFLVIAFSDLIHGRSNSISIVRDWCLLLVGGTEFLFHFIVINLGVSCPFTLHLPVLVVLNHCGTFAIVYFNQVFCAISAAHLLDFSNTRCSLTNHWSTAKEGTQCLLVDLCTDSTFNIC